MVTSEFVDSFKKKYRKLKDMPLKQKVKNQIQKIIQNPEIGKPMSFERKGTREVYISSFRLCYQFIEQEDKVIFVDLYHKDEQ